MGMEEGEFLVRAARRAIEEHLAGREWRPEEYSEVLRERMGVFTTLRLHPGGELRGCIGFPEPVMPLIDALLDSAISAATRDPRFPPVRLEEMDHIVVEVTVLTPPEPIEAPPERLPEEVVVGRDGLLVRYGIFSGLLLPQVPVEFGWDSRQFLEQTCMKAGLPPDCWRRGARFYRFQGQIFEEVEPRGRVVERPLGYSDVSLQ